jgi:two-component system sensor histidine kinase RegB
VIDSQDFRALESGIWGSDDNEKTLKTESARHLALRWVVRLRFGLIAGEVALAGALHMGLGIELPEGGIALAIAAQALSNVWLHLRGGRLGRYAEHTVGTLFVLDTLGLTLILAFSGGPANPFSLLYLVQITFSAVVLRKTWTWALGLLSSLCFALLFWIARDVPAFHEHNSTGEFSLHLFGIWLAFTIGALLISFFVGKMSAESREKQYEIRRMQRRLARQDRLASLVTLAAGAAHEIATPLATIAVTAKELEHNAQGRPGSELLKEDARLIRSQVERCRAILERMGAQGADLFGETPRSIHLTELLEMVADRFPKDRERLQIQVQGGGDPRSILPVRAALEALGALVKNAIDASPNGAPIQLHAMKADTGEVRFFVRDEGIGMTPEALERVAEPFFTTKAPGEGMGLGAFLAHLFAQTLGGQLSFDSAPGQGCTAILDLPATHYGKS